MFCTNRNVFLIGLMAVGKTTIGRLLADELTLEFYDSDRVIEERAGAEIADLRRGARRFRDRKHR
jgi:shikimate kinase